MLQASQILGNHTVCVSAPSNIAFLKYWGKKDAIKQIPAGPSLSMTLDACRTETVASCLQSIPADHCIELNGKQVSRQQHPKVYAHLDRIRERYFPGARSLYIRSRNCFPTGAGIASSASGFAALTIAAIACWNGVDSFQALEAHGWSRAQLADEARQGSGSACRSLWGGYVTWQGGVEPQTFQVEEDEAHWSLADTIVLISKEQKTVSSSVAHQAAWASPFFRPRLAGLGERLAMLQQALAQCDMDALGQWIEADALEMHAVMMTGSPAVQYLSERSLELVAWLRQLRQRTNLQAYFTIDAGPNIHIISPLQQQPTVVAALQEAFADLELILDRVGSGPRFCTNMLS